MALVVQPERYSVRIYSRVWPPSRILCLSERNESVDVSKQEAARGMGRAPVEWLTILVTNALVYRRR